jgi:hypothetical protein
MFNRYGKDTGECTGRTSKKGGCRLHVGER